MHTFSTQVIRAIEDICHEHDFHIIVCNADDDSDKEKRYIVDDYVKSLELKQIQNGLKEMLSLENPPQAILAGNDLALIEILKYIKGNDIKIPEELLPRNTAYLKNLKRFNRLGINLIKPYIFYLTQ